jgi:1,2-phenylacetyl-CoA epoxidase PaaB subunit
MHIRCNATHAATLCSDSMQQIITDNHDMFWRKMEATTLFAVKSQQVLDTTREIIKEHKQMAAHIATIKMSF